MVPSFLSKLFRRKRIASLEDLVAFLREEAARVAQVSLFGYLRARMGTQWPAHFEDPAFAPAIQTAQQAGYRMCLADLAVFAVAEIGGSAQTVEALFAELGEQIEPIAERMAALDANAPAETAFHPSLERLIDLAPVSLDFQTRDREAFTNALTLRWAEVRRRFHARVDRGELVLALHGLESSFGSSGGGA